MRSNVEFAVHFLIKKGLGPDWMPKTIFIAYDDLDTEMDIQELKRLAKHDAERELYQSEDYKLYGKNWQYDSIDQI